MLSRLGKVVVNYEIDFHNLELIWEVVFCIL